MVTRTERPEGVSEKNSRITRPEADRAANAGSMALTDRSSACSRERAESAGARPSCELLELSSAHGTSRPNTALEHIRTRTIGTCVANPGAPIKLAPRGATLQSSPSF
jgi:hypothetical protein